MECQRAATEGGFSAGSAILLNGIALVDQRRATANLVGVPGCTSSIKECWSEFGHVGHRTDTRLFVRCIVNFYVVDAVAAATIAS